MKKNIGKIKLNNTENKFKDLFYYALSKTIIVFLFKLNFGILKNICRVFYFYDDLGFFKMIIELWFGLLSFITGVIFVIITSVLIGINLKNFKPFCKKDELKEIFYFIAIISVLFFKGNPLINNYYGVYNLNKSGLFIEDNWKVFDKTKIESYDLYVNYYVDYYAQNYIKENVKYNDLTKDDKEKLDELDIYLRKIGYVFQESAFFDGYYSYQKGNDFVSKYKYFYFYIIEKTIIVLLFFFLPFITVLYYFGTENKKKYTILIVLTIPIISYFGYPSEQLQSDLYTTSMLLFIGLINIFPITSIYSKLQYKLNDEKLINKIYQITFISIVVFVIIKGYLIFWGKLSLIIPLLIWWHIVCRLRESVTSK